MPDGERIKAWEPKMFFLMKKIKPPTTANNSLILKLNLVNNSKIRVEFKGERLKQDKITFTLTNVTHLFILYELDPRSKDFNDNCTLKNCLFGAFKLTKNADKFSR